MSKPGFSLADIKNCHLLILSACAYLPVHLTSFPPSRMTASIESFDDDIRLSACLPVVRYLTEEDSKLIAENQYNQAEGKIMRVVSRT
jgi:hypothetical protein